MYIFVCYQGNAAKNLLIFLSAWLVKTDVSDLWFRSRQIVIAHCLGRELITWPFLPLILHINVFILSKICITVFSLYKHVSFASKKTLPWHRKQKVLKTCRKNLDKQRIILVYAFNYEWSNNKNLDNKVYLNMIHIKYTNLFCLALLEIIVLC